MKTRTLLIIYCLFNLISACKKLDIPPMNVIQDKDVFTSVDGINIYMARIYSELPIEDFRYNKNGLNNFYIKNPISALTGEALSLEQTSAGNEAFGYWPSAYSLIRETNYFLQTLPKYASHFSEDQIRNWQGEARFIRAMTYFALVKRYGGVPIVDTVLSYPEMSIEELNMPRAAEADVYDFIGADLDFAISHLNETSVAGRVNKYAAAAFKSRAMLYAGSIAKYNKISLFDKNNQRLCGIPQSKAAAYFKASYDASMLLEGKYSLYKKSWKKDDKQAQFQNYVDLFFDPSSPENIFVKQYKFPESVHGYDAYFVPRQLAGQGGYAGRMNPTLDLVEMYDGIPKNADGTIQTLDKNGHYILYDHRMDLFKNAEPRLRATVILPGDQFKGEAIDIRRGIYTGAVTSGISRLIPKGSTEKYPDQDLVTSANGNQTPYQLPDGTKMTPAGASGIFNAEQIAAISGFSIRKYLDPNRASADVLENHSDQTWIEMRYGEVLLNRAEAAFELHLAGENDKDYLQQAYTAISKIRERAGADPLGSPASLSLDIIRKERRKELAFENKTYWDLIRWRIFDKEQNGRLFRTLMPFYAAKAGKYFFDARYDQRNIRYTFDPRWYYEPIPAGEISKSNQLIQNPGY